MNHSHWPPKLFLLLFRWFAHPKLRDHIEGDLIEAYNVQRRKRGKTTADFKFIVDVLLLFRPAIIKPAEGYKKLNSYGLFKSNLTSGLRILLRKKTYSLINVIGLSIGLAFALLIFIYVIDELSYDRFFKESDKIFRIAIREKYEGTEITYVESAAPLADALRRDVPQIVKTVRTAYAKGKIVGAGDKSFREERVLFADSTFFDVFSYHLIQGNPRECLRGPNRVVLTESAARKYFGEAPAMGKIIGINELNETMPSIVTGIMPDVPYNTHMKFDMILSMDSWDFAVNNTRWSRFDLHNYFKIDETASIAIVEKQLDYYVERNLIPELEEHLGTSMRINGNEVHYFIQPITSIHLNSGFNGEFEANSDARYVYIFSSIAIFTILLACISFINLAMAHASIRGKEVGVRTVVGASRSWLVRQFMIESFLYVSISGICALIIILLLLEPFNMLSGKNFTLGTFANPIFLTGMAFFMIVIGFISGTYPAFYLTSFKAVAVLKGKIISRSEGYRLRNSLVVFQFTVSLALIIITFIIQGQLQLIQHQNLGFDRQNLIIVRRTDDIAKERDAFKDELMRHSEFVNISLVHQAPPEISESLMIKGANSDKFIATYWATFDGNYPATMGLSMKSGRFYQTETSADSNAIVINEAAAKLIGDPKPGEKIRLNNLQFDLVGIIKNFNFESLHGKIDPLVIARSDWYHSAVVRIKPGSAAEAAKILSDTWSKFSDLPIEYSFMDEDFNAQFRIEQKMGKLFQVSTGVAIFIACLGLFGLITLTSAQRAKEIGIRKVLGASVAQVTIMLSGELFKLILISFLIAVPLAWYCMERWLENFAYRINFDFVIVMYAGIAGIFFAIATVVYKSFSIASANTFAALKSE